jgi:hypothetical protein
MTGRNQRAIDRAIRQDVANEKKAQAAKKKAELASKKKEEASQKAVQKAIREDIVRERNKRGGKKSKIPDSFDEIAMNDLEGKNDRELMESVIPYLLMRSYHLPGYSYGHDLWQFLINNHPVFGICCHHPLHPVKSWMRVAALIGSIMMGLAITNIIYLAFVFTDQDYNKAYVAVPFNQTYTHNDAINKAAGTLTMSNGNIALWTIGSVLNSLYDTTIWSIAAWNWKGNLKGRIASYQSTIKNVLIVFSVVVAVALSTLAFAIRSALDRDKVDASELESSGFSANEMQLIKIDKSTDFEFMIAYLIELLATYFVWYFVVGFILFTGVLGCYKYPIVGGRPYEIKVEQQERGRLNAEGEGIEVGLS